MFDIMEENMNQNGDLGGIEEVIKNNNKHKQYTCIVMQVRKVIGRLYLNVQKTSSKGTLWTFYIIVLLLTLLFHQSAAHTWEQPGCHRVGNTRRVNIPDCVGFNVTLNACRGFCESYAIPSPSRTIDVNMKHLITSRAECCSIKETHDVKVLVQCIDGLREIVFKSAKSCSCSICRK